jgi:hypothetical protein
MFNDRNVATNPSSLLVEAVDDAELVRLKDGRGLRVGFCCAALAKYDAGFWNDRLAIS